MDRAKLWLRIATGGVVVALTVASGGVALGRQSAGVDSPRLRVVAIDVQRAQLRPFVLQNPPLPVPSASPGDAFVPRAVDALGAIEMPTIGVSHTMFEGVDQAALAQGPGHWPGTAEPGGWGNAVVAGHRVSYGGPFRGIEELQPGDPIVLRTAEGTFTYTVTAEQVVTPTDVWIIDQHPGRTITLFACHPLGSATHRYVVTGMLTSMVSATAAA
jgi:LPXTG-site transpeptidase (sortase) family protein